LQYFVSNHIISPQDCRVAAQTLISMADGIMSSRELICSPQDRARYMQDQYSHYLKLVNFISDDRQ